MSSVATLSIAMVTVIAVLMTAAVVRQHRLADDDGGREGEARRTRPNAARARSRRAFVDRLGMLFWLIASILLVVAALGAFD